MSVARRIRTGTLAINGYGFTIASPFGGIKQSGIGREHGDEGIRSMLEYKSVKVHESMTDSQWV
jgi:acyl-CoA reductase-like NAD-dependent aldehyde dehydrogenase